MEKSASSDSDLSSNFSSFTEGKAEIIFPKDNEVFYNPVQQFNRDLSVLAIRTWSEEQMEYRKVNGSNNSRKKRAKRNKDKNVTTDGDEGEKVADKNDDENIREKHDKNLQQPYINILEALSATGLRAIRYAKEIPMIRSIIANDLSKSAVESIKRNIEHNKVEQIVQASQADANALMYSRGFAGGNTRVHCIDLDPYGTAAPFLDAAVQTIADNGLLLVTCTDVSVLAGGSYPEKCYANYGGLSIKCDFSHEVALRLVLHAISSSAARYGKSIEPLVSLSIDFYVRIFVKINTSPAKAKFLAHNSMITYTCSGCQSVSLQPFVKVTKVNERENKHRPAAGPPMSTPHGDKCQFCGFTLHIGGPMWSGKIHNREFISKMLEIRKTLDPEIYGTLNRIDGMLSVALQELEDAPFYIHPDFIASCLNAVTPAYTKIASAIVNAGYKVSETHAQPGSIKTDAPFSVIWDIMLAWIDKLSPINKDKVKPNTVAAGILERLGNNDTSNIDFTINQTAPKRAFSIVRYPMLPPNWGPKAKATGGKSKKRKIPAEKVVDDDNVDTKKSKIEVKD